MYILLSCIWVTVEMTNCMWYKTATHFCTFIQYNPGEAAPEKIFYSLTFYVCGYYNYYLYLAAAFQGKLDQLVPPGVLCLHWFQKRTSGVLWISWAGCPTIRVKALKGTQSTSPKEWFGLMLSFSHIQTPDRRGVAAFMLAIWRQYHFVVIMHDLQFPLFTMVQVWQSLFTTCLYAFFGLPVILTPPTS